MSRVHIITAKRIEGYAADHAAAAPSLARWLQVAEAATWTSFADVQAVFRTADQVKVESGKTVVIFNIGGNNFRLITAIHYNRQRVYALRFMTHAEYSKDHWKETL